MVSKRTGRARALRFLLAAGGVLGLVGIGLGVAFYLTILRDLPDLDRIEDYRPPLASVVTDRNGQRIGEFFVERRALLRLADVPHHVVRAFLAAEDAGFFEHAGIDLKSILRAAWANLRAGGKVQGASTITQQTVKGLLLSPEQTYTRKLREIVLARDLERRFTKQEILYLYLNQIYFGQGAYGIQEAARSYFAKPVDELTVSEAALLAGLPKAPSRFSPFRNPERAEQRRVYVLTRMLEENYIDPETHDRALAEPPELSEQAWRESYAAAAYFTEEVRRTLFDALGGDVVLEGGLRIETTLDLEHQRVAVGAVQAGLEALDRRQGYRGPLRQVAAEQIEEEIANLAVTNGLVSEDDSPDLPPPTLEAKLEEGALEGVVTAVSRKDEHATVQFAPEKKARVALEDVSWARKRNPDVRGVPVKQIDKVLRVGDVARFVRVEGAKGDTLRVTLAQTPTVQGGLFSLDVATGDVLAMVGGYDFAESQFNRVTQARRQPGSAFKPLVYGAALSLRNDGGARYTPASIIHDRPKVYRDHQTGLVWKPKNYGREFYGPITLRRALAKSINTAAVHLCDEVGVGNVIRYARKLGIESPLEPSLGLALGTSGVSLLELTRSYAVFAAQGRKVAPRFIRRVSDRDGNVLLENLTFGEDEPGEEEASETESPDVASGPDGLERAPALPEDPAALQVIPREQAYLMADMLRAVVVEGTGRRAAKLGRPLAGKTGTTNDQADAWFVGFSPEVATGVWVGHDEIQFLGAGETGSRAAAPIWVDYMGQVLAGVPKRDFSLPPAIVFARIDRATGLLANEQSQDTVFQPFVAGTEPTETAATRRTNSEAMRNLREDSLGGSDALQLMRNDGF
jgi:penicillin-binding protein 1A